MSLQLPDIDSESWDDYAGQRLQQELQSRIDNFGLQQAIGEKMAAAQSLLGGTQEQPPPEPPPPEPAPAPPPPDLSRIGGWAEPAPQAPDAGAAAAAAAASGQPQVPEPEPAPEPTPAPQPQYDVTPSSPVTAPLRQPTPAGAPTADQGSDWGAQLLANVAGAGGDVSAFTNHLSNLGGVSAQNALAAASQSGANIQQFSSNFSAPPPEPPAAGPSPGGGRPAGTPSASLGGVPDWLSTLIAQNAPPELAADPDFIRTVAAGAKAESGWDPNAVQKGGGGRGLFQFDLGGMGAPYAKNESVLLGESGAQLQASQIVPLYAKAYASAPAGLSGAEKASWVAAQAERPYQYDNPQSTARRNYASAYGEIGGAGPAEGASTQELLSRTGSWTPPAKQISQFGDPQLSNDEAYAACGPAAAVRFAQMYGRNPSLREATDLAATVGWTSGGGMAGIGSEKALLDKMGIPTTLTNDTAAMAREASTGNPVTISTPGHYFFADGYDANTGAFHVGQSGLDLRGGSEWMTPAQMEARMGAIQGGLLADNPRVPAASTADMDTNPVSYLGRAKDAIGSTITSAKQSVEDFLSPQGQRELFPATYAAQDAQVAQLDNAVQSSATQRLQPGSPGGPPDYTDFGRANAAAVSDQAQSQSPIDRLKGAFSDFIDSVGGAAASPEGQAAGSAVTDFARNGPIGFTRDRLQDAGAAVTSLPGVDDLYQARKDLGQQLVTQPPVEPTDVYLQTGLDPNSPVTRALSGAANLGTQLVGGFLKQPDFQEASDVMAEMANKYPLGGQSGKLAGILPDIDAMTPEDRQRYSEAAMNVGGMVQPLERGAGEQAGQAAGATARELQGQISFLTERLPNMAPEAQAAVRQEIDKIRAEMGQAGRAVGEAPPTAAESAFAGAEAAPGQTVTAETPNATVSVTRNGAPPAEPRASAEAPPTPGTPAWEQYRQDLWERTRRKFGAEPTPQGAQPIPEGAQPITLTTDQERARLNLGQYPEELQNLIADHAEGIDWARAQRRGVVPDEVSRQMADQYANDTTLKQVINEGKAGQAYNDYQTRAIRNATGAQAATVRSAVAKIIAGDDSSTALRDFALEADRLDQVVKVAEGARAEAGRSLRAWQDPVRLVDMSPDEAVTEISKSLGGDRAKLLDAVREYQTLADSGAGPTKLANFWAQTKNPVGPGDWFKLVRYNSMLSGPRTFEVNAISNSLELPWRLARDVGASTLRGRPGEVGVEMSGAYAGLQKANRAFLDTLFNGITAEQAARGELPRDLSARVRNPVGKKIAQVLEPPSRLLAAADEWAKAIDYGMSFGRLAARQASEEGLRGEAWSTRTAQLMSAPETNPALMRRASDMADRMTWKGDMGNIGEGLQAFTRRTGPIGNLILPFLRTSYQITTRGIERSPLGLIGTGIDVARGAYGPDLRAAMRGEGPRPKGVTPLGERLGDNLMGTAIFGGLYYEAQQNNISGAGPDSTQDKKLLLSQGWQPYSVKVGDRWVSYANWGPAAIPFAMAAAAAETQRFAKPGAETLDLVLDGTRRTAQIAQEQTYLQAIGTAWKAMQDPASYGSQFVNDTISSLIPYGGTINTVAQAMDPNARRADRLNILDAIQSRLPSGTPLIGGRSEVPVSQDVLGRPLPNPAAGAGAIIPVRSTQATTDPLLAEMDRIGYAPPAAPKTFTRGPWTYELTPEEQRDIYSKAGDLIAARAGDDLNSQAYRNLNDTGKAKRIQMIVDAARTQAENQWLRSLNDEELAKRQAKSAARKEIVPVSGRG